ncbi:MAG: hypothetical protein HQL29_02315 [Candidatus Omnitrophica bacterium]|nr:hypothetical protein [Candidatus Omnitrophota bacterium]
MNYCSAEDLEIKRTVLALYDSSEPYLNKSDYNYVHLAAEVILNYLGLIVEYYDIAGSFPDQEVMKDKLGVITWFSDDEMPNAKEYCLWVKKQIDEGKKYVIMGRLGAQVDSITKKEVPLTVVREPFAALGLNYDGYYTDNPLIISTEFKDKRMVEFERSLEGEVNTYVKIQPLMDNAEVYLYLKLQDIENSKSAVVVATGNGAFALDGYDMYRNEAYNLLQWRVDPFRFFSKAFGIEKLPAYDTTTLFGKRIFYSHIDGDGLRNVSYIDKKTLSGKIICQEILKKYDLPITISFITSELDERYYGTAETLSLAKEMAELNNVELGIHGFTHPLDWEKMLTAFPVEGYAKKAMMKDELNIVGESHYEGSSIVTVSRNEFLEKEINEAADFLNIEIAPRGKKAKVYQWTGDCAPGEDAIKQTREAGLLNINGGDTRFDSFRNSYTSVAPLLRQKGKEKQVYTSNANENIYTNLWTGPFYGFKNVIETIKNTEKPEKEDPVFRRLTPINIYYHFYSGERQQALDALKEAYDYSLNENIIPIFTSEYLKVVEGFFSGKLFTTDEGAWRFENYGECRTIRVNKEQGYPDIERSKNILGYSKWEQFIYVHLADGNLAELFFKKDDNGNIPFLVEASTVIKDVSIASEKITFNTESFNGGEYEFNKMMPAEKYHLSIMDINEKKEKKNIIIRSDKNGRLNFEFSDKGLLKVTVYGVEGKQGA